LNKALAEHRAGNFAAAESWLEKFRAKSPPLEPNNTRFAPFYALGYAVAALNFHRQQQPTEAAAYLAKAQATVDQYMPDGSAARPLDFNWDDWLRARLLLREATKTLHEAGPQKSSPGGN
jgi:hypothetical protein